MALVWRIRDRATFAAFRGPEARARRFGPVRVTYVPADAVSLPADRVAVAYGVGRHVGGAVVRNRLRRRCRAVVQNAAGAGRLPGGAYLVALSPEAAGAEPADLRTELERALAEVTA